MSEIATPGTIDILSKKKILIHTIALNRADLLKKMVESIDTKHEWDLVIDVVSKDPDILNYLESEKPTSEYWSKILLHKDSATTMHINNIGYNIGVAQCWNDALEYGYEKKKYDRILFVNSDIEFGPGDIDKMIAFSEAKPDKLITVCGTHGKHADWDEKNLSHGFAAAILPPKIFEEVGYFDENFFPAYNEDCDYFTRLWLSRNLGPIKPGYDKISAKDSPIVECLRSGHTHHEGSCVIYSDAKMMRLNLQSHSQNNRYYFAKWGELNDKEVNTTPFNEELEYRIDLSNRHNPYPDHWDRSKEKERYYKTCES